MFYSFSEDIFLTEKACLKSIFLSLFVILWTLVGFFVFTLSLAIFL